MVHDVACLSDGAAWLIEGHEEKALKLFLCCTARFQRWSLFGLANGVGEAGGKSARSALAFASASSTSNPPAFAF
jgi:hypothetical protein